MNCTHKHCSNRLPSDGTRSKFCSSDCRRRHRCITRTAKRAARLGRPNCPRPYKVVYGTLEAAESDLARIQVEMSDYDLETYPCACGVWHIGHKTKATDVLTISA